MVAADVPYYTLNNGTKMPSVGIGCWMGQPGSGETTEKMVKTALKHGYRHIDTAFGYGNEEYVGKAIRESGVSRDEIYVTTKLTGKHHGSVKEGFEISLNNLNIGYIDLFLMHWPMASNDKGENLQPDESPTFVETWLEMEKLLETGKVKTIGVSNFSIKNLEILLPKVNVVPANNQVELHPCLPQEDLKKYCDDKGILLTAYSPFGQPSPDRMVLIKDSTVSQIAEKTNSSVGQVLVSWAVLRGTAVVPKSEKEERIKQNITLVNLSGDDMKTLNELHKQEGMHRSLMGYHSEKGIFGWTYDQLGWNTKQGGYVV